MEPYVQSQPRPDKLLIVDDRRENLVALRGVLAELNVEIFEADNGNDALAATLHHEFALAILDVSMPGMDGYELASLLRGDYRTQRLPIIFLTASRGEEENIYRGYASGAVDYIVKPYAPDVLLAKVRLFLELHRTHVTLSEKVMALSASEERFRNLVMTIPDIVYRLDVDGRFTFLNDSVRQLGYAPEELVGLHFSAIMLPEDARAASRTEVLPGFAGQKTGAEAAPKLFDERRSGARHTVGLEVRLTPKPGHKAANGLLVSLGDQYITVEVNSSGVYGAAADQQRSLFLGTVGVIRDISERKRLMTELKTARDEAEMGSRVKSAFLATMSHEIRTPMNGVVGMLEMLLRGQLSAHQVEQANTARESAESLLRIIDDILDFSKIEAGRLELEPGPVGVRGLVEGVCTSLVTVADKRNVDLQIFVSPQLPDWVISDEIRLRQILYNLLGNAIKFSGNRPGIRGQVSIRAERLQAEPPRLTVRIEDNGIGMTPETLDNIFQPFSQAELSTTRRFGGTGLGLAICKHLVDLLEGEIGATSIPGQGSTFTVSLPLRKAPDQPVPALPDLAGLTAVLYGFDAQAATDLAAYLEYAGGRVEVTDAAEKLDALLTTDRESVLIADLREGAGTEVPQVKQRGSGVLFLTRGRRTKPRVKMDGSVSLDVGFFRLQPFLEAVLLAAGRLPAQAFSSISAEGKTPEQGLPAAQVKESAGSGRILVVEDDEINQKVIMQQLALLGLSADLAYDGEAALDLWREGEYALLLTDLHMPRMDGYSLVKSIRSEERQGGRIPILALTANAVRGADRRALDMGIDAYLTKPIRLEKLQTALEYWLLKESPEPSDNVGIKGARRTAAESVELPLDLTRLADLVGDESEVIRQFLSDYLESASQQRQTLRDAQQQGDIARVGALAHQLKSSSRSVGAEPLGGIYEALEKACLNAVGPEVDAWVAESDNEWRTLEPLIRDRIETQE